MKAYIAGKIPKGKDSAAEDWQSRYKTALLGAFPSMEFFNPTTLKLDEKDVKLVFGADCGMIKKSDLVVINAELKLGAGTAQEMVIAKHFKKPVVCVMPKGSHHRKDVVINGETFTDWIHPFIYSMADFVISDISEIDSIKDKVFSSPVKDISVIDEAVDYAWKWI